MKASGKRSYKRYLDKVQKKIFYCYNCQAFDSGDIIWVQGDKISMTDLMWECKVPEKFREELADEIFCPNCGTGNLGLGADVGLQTQFEKDLSTLDRKAKSIYERDVKVLEELLTSFPSLALKNKFGRKLYNEIETRKLPVVEIEGFFFRARIGDGSNILTSKDMMETPLGKSSEGRFNHAGQSHLYLSSDKYTAQFEVTSRDSLVWYQQMTIEKSVANILDLTIEWDETTLSTSTILVALNVGKSLRRFDRNINNWKPDYFITRYIMDCAKASGYLGIKYDSAKSVGYNVVLFYPDKIRFKKSRPKISRFLIDSREKGIHKGRTKFKLL